MALFAKFESSRAIASEIVSKGRNPFNVQFDRLFSATEASLDGQRVLLLGTNNYFGLTFDEGCIEASTRAIRESGTGTTGSRIANGTYSYHVLLERRIAEFYGRKGAIVFSTGYQANLGLISTIAGLGDHLLIDADSHASIYDAGRLSAAEVIRFRHNAPEDLARRLRRLKGSEGDCVIVVEGIYSMLGDTAPLKEIAAIKREMGAYLVVDEAHSLGVLGENGRGLCEAAGIEGETDFVVGTFSKSLGAIGGFATSDHPELDLLRVVCRPYMFTASLPPGVVASVTAALARISSDGSLSRRVWANCRRLHHGLGQAGFAVGPEPTPIVAVRMPNRELAVEFWDRLVDEGVYVNLALPPATPGGICLIRTSVSSAHTETQIDRAISTMTSVGRAIGALDGA